MNTVVVISKSGRKMKEFIFNFVHGVFRVLASQVLGGNVIFIKSFLKRGAVFSLVKLN